MNQLKLPIIPHLSMNMTSLLPTENKCSKKTLRKTSLMTDHLFHPHPAMQTSSPNCPAEILTQTAHCQPPPEMHEKRSESRRILSLVAMNFYMVKHITFADATKVLRNASTPNGIQPRTFFTPKNVPNQVALAFLKPVHVNALL